MRSQGRLIGLLLAASLLLACGCRGTRGSGGTGGKFEQASAPRADRDGPAVRQVSHEQPPQPEPDPAEPDPAEPDPADGDGPVNDPSAAAPRPSVSDGRPPDPAAPLPNPPSVTPLPPGSNSGGNSGGSSQETPERLPAPQRVEPFEPLALEDVIRSVQQSYPLLQVALRERQVASGKQLSAWGEFDLNVKGSTISQPLGFYQTYRNQLSLEQPTFGGGYVYSGYKIGRGSFQPWFKERETNDGGEFSLGLGAALLKNRAIDDRRAGVWQAGLDRRIVEPAIRAQTLEFVRQATQVYWTWVASGQVLQAQRELLRLAESRVRQIEQRLEAGDLGRIVRINNDQLIASREAKVIEAERKLQMAAIKLSLFFRDGQGRPIVPDASLLPPGFPDPSPPDPEQARQDIQQALAARPELVELDLTAQRIRIDLAKAQNSLLPKLDAVVLAAKDVGGPANSKRDKSPFELEAGLYGELPVQRREARGKIQAARGKLSQLQAKREFTINKITAEVQDALSALRAAVGRIDRAVTNLQLARETLRLGRDQFEVGDIDLIDLNIYEQAATDAQFLLIASRADFFIALADYRAALARDPLVAPEP